jgi:hypothetical protein
MTGVLSATGVFAVMTLGFSPALAQFSFDTDVEYTTSGFARGLAVGDFDGDNHPDVAIFNRFSSNVPVYLNPDGTGVLTAGDTLTAGVMPRMAIAVDLNADGWCDLANVNSSSTDITVFLNKADDGSGQWLGFVNAVAYDVGSNVQGITSGDFDGDGLIDLVAANYGVSNDVDNTISFWFGQGDGTFGSRLDESGGVGSRPISICSADFDGDLDTDLGVLDTFGQPMQLWLNLGQSGGEWLGFNKIKDMVYEVGSKPRVIECADLDADGDVDLVIANWASNSVTILWNAGDATFTGTTIFNVNTKPEHALPIDIDGDGLLDLAVALWETNEIGFYRQDCNHVFSSAGTMAVGVAPKYVARADLDADGDDDLIVANSYASANGTISVLINRTHQGVCEPDFNCDGFVNSQDFTAFLNAFVAGSASADYNSDGAVNSKDFVAFLNDFVIGCG